MISLCINTGDKLPRREELDAALAGHASLLSLLERPDQAYADSLGWLDPEKWAGDKALQETEAIAAEVRQHADAFVLIGVGGSNNGARAVIKALQPAGTPEIIYMGNSLSPHALSRALDRLKGKSVYVNCIAKNFETLEPGVSFRLLRQWLNAQYGDEACRRIITTGTPGSHLEALSRENGWRFTTFPPDIGGRYSALSPVGLLPMAVAGLDIRTLAAGAVAMHQELLACKGSDNTALQYACLRNLLYEKGYKLELLSAFEPQFRYFFKWWEQLFAESEGKDGKGLFPITAEYSEELHSLGQYVQDGEAIIFETFLDVKRQNANLCVPPSSLNDGFAYLDGKDLWEVNKAAYTATQAAHSQKLPCLTLQLDALDEYHFGQLFYFFQASCYLSGVMLGINPFNQPGVETYKVEMFRALGKKQ